MPRPLRCPCCGAPAAVTEETRGLIDWGPAVVGDDDVVRPLSGEDEQRVDHGYWIGRPRGVCANAACGHQWTLRRKFDPST